MTHDDVPLAHALRIAVRTMELSCLAVKLLGAPNHHEAAALLREHGKKAPITVHCKCVPRQENT